MRYPTNATYLCALAGIQWHEVLVYVTGSTVGHFNLPNGAFCYNISVHKSNSANNTPIT